jgi:hypothetical protein
MAPAESGVVGVRRSAVCYQDTRRVRTHTLSLLDVSGNLTTGTSADGLGWQVSAATPLP